MLILGIESSCDDAAAAVIESDRPGIVKVRASSVAGGSSDTVRGTNQPVNQRALEAPSMTSAWLVITPCLRALLRT